MNRTCVETYRAATPTLEAGVANAANPAFTEAGDKGMSIAELRMCPLPPLHDNPLLNHADADQEVRNWLCNGAKPQSLEQVNRLAFFCVKQKLPNALSWLVLQCDVDKLTLKHGYLGVEGAHMIASWLERCPRPIALDFSCQEIEDEGAVALAGALKTNSMLTSLNLTYNWIGATGATALAEALKTNSTLTSLNVSVNVIGDIGATAFGDALKTNSTLRSLDAKCNRFGPTGAAAFADALKINSTLTSLELGGNSFGDIGATAFADALKINSALTSLELKNSNTCASGAEAFADALKTNTTLTSLSVEANFIDNTGATTPGSMILADFTSAFAVHQDEIDRRLTMNAKANQFVFPAAEAFMTLPISWEWELPFELGALIVKNMITLGPDEGDGLEALKSLGIASYIVQQRRLDETA